MIKPDRRDKVFKITNNHTKATSTIATPKTFKIYLATRNKE